MITNKFHNKSYENGFKKKKKLQWSTMIMSTLLQRNSFEMVFAFLIQTKKSSVLFEFIWKDVKLLFNKLLPEIYSPITRW